MKKFLRTLLVMAMALLMVAMTACAKTRPQRRLRPQRKQIRARRRPRRLPALNLYWEPSL